MSHLRHLSGKEIYNSDMPSLVLFSTSVYIGVGVKVRVPYMPSLSRLYYLTSPDGIRLPGPDSQGLPLLKYSKVHELVGSATRGNC